MFRIFQIFRKFHIFRHETRHETRDETRNETSQDTRDMRRDWRRETRQNASFWPDTTDKTRDEKRWTRHEMRLKLSHKAKCELLDVHAICLEFSRRMLGGCSEDARQLPEPLMQEGLSDWIPPGASIWSGIPMRPLPLLVGLCMIGFTFVQFARWNSNYYYY